MAENCLLPDVYLSCQLVEVHRLTGQHAQYSAPGVVSQNIQNNVRFQLIPLQSDHHLTKIKRNWWTFSCCSYMSMSPIPPPMPPPPLPPGLGMSLGFDAAMTSSILSIMHAASVAAFMTCSLTASGS